MAFEIGLAYASPGEQGFLYNALFSNSAPGATNDNTQGFAIGSIWANYKTGLVYKATAVGTGAATWSNIATILPMQGSESNDTWERRCMASF